MIAMRARDNRRHGRVAKAAGVIAAVAAMALAGAAHVVEHAISQQACAAVPIETRGIVAEWVGATEELTLWAATQSPVEVRSVSARILGIPEHAAVNETVESGKASVRGLVNAVLRRAIVARKRLLE